MTAMEAARERQRTGLDPVAVKRAQDKYRAANRNARNAQKANWHKANPEHVRNYRQHYAERGKMLRRKRDYGLTQEAYEGLYRQQNGRCAICRRADGDNPLQVDHNHVTGKVRGLLCWSCNFAIGHLKVPEVCESAAKYLQDRGYYRKVE